jgi:hypothetical protein
MGRTKLRRRMQQSNGLSDTSVESHTLPLLLSIVGDY